jgi:ADP-ribose pyrophosphatase YjhB (NUDIX family)
MTYFPAEKGQLPKADLRVPQALYDEAHRSFPIGYSDVVLRNPATGEFFFPIRDIEPRKGTEWFIGGRGAVGESVEQSAVRHVQHDTGLELTPDRFTDVSNFEIADIQEREGQEDHVRQAKDTVLVADLKPDEIEALNETVKAGKLRAEYSGGEWYDPKTGKKDLPGPLKQFMRDFFSHQVMMGALQTMAEEEDKQRSR